MDLLLADRIRGAVWGMLIADALASPTHWFYGGKKQVAQFFGAGGIKGYTAPLSGRGAFPPSIMALSNTGGAGRRSGSSRPHDEIVGEVINRGKRKYWEAGSGYHYHCTLQRGENTLEGSISRMAIRALSHTHLFDKNQLQKEYVDFMTRPNSHNDAYASSYHRLFFERMASGSPLNDCPSNDGHNVDAIDGLVIPMVVLLAGASHSEQIAVENAIESVSVTRKSARVEAYIAPLSFLLRQILAGEKITDAAQSSAKHHFPHLKLDPQKSDPVVACYIDQNYESLLHFAAKYDDLEEALLANANAGGENVHRGLILGALFGAAAGESQIGSHLKSGLLHHDDIAAEIDSFVGRNLRRAEL